MLLISHLTFIKRPPVAEYRSQKRGGKGVIGAETYEEDFVENLFTASTHDYILFRATGRATAGVTDMRFKLASDYLDVIEVVDHGAKFLVASEAGLGVRTRFEDYRLINRGGSGVRLVTLEPGDKLFSIARIIETEEEAAAEAASTPAPAE